MQAEQEPNEYMSVALDGTVQMPQEFSHFRQKLKDDSPWQRLQVHTQIAMVHGWPPMVFVANEDIYEILTLQSSV